MSRCASHQTSSLRSADVAGPASVRPGRTDTKGISSPLSNQALQRLLLSSGVQPKLTVNQPGDAYEQEADLVADAVMRMPEPGAAAPAITPLSPSGLQRKCAACEAGGATCAGCAEEEEHVQRQAEDAGPAPEPEASPIPRGGGQPLATSVRGFFEPRFGRDLGNVRIHTGADADGSARAFRALAYTHRSDIVFRSGQYSPDTPAGRRLLAHELTHVVQQGGSGSSPTIQRVCSSADKNSCSEEDLLTAVCIGETGNINDSDGHQGVMNVVQNRTRDSAFGAATIRGQANLILDAETIAPPPAVDRLNWPQYSACRPLAQKVLAGTGGDPTLGAVFFDQCCERPCDQFCTGYLGDGKTRAHYFGRRATADERAACADKTKNPESCPALCGDTTKNLASCDKRCCKTGRKKGPVPSYPGLQAPATEQASQESASQESAQSPGAEPAATAM
jgi:Domain of unknown function (DUF4157)